MITSNQIAGVVGGQQVMFANQAAFAHQISGQMGFGTNGPTGQQMQSTPAGAMPSYGYGWGDSTQVGTQVAGGMANLIPAGVTGASIAGGMMGGVAGWADPFTGTARGFARGAGFGGAGFMDTMGGIGRAFAGGGMRAGMGAIAGGALAATGVGLGYYAAGKAVTTVAEGIYGGAQNISDVGRMAGQYMTPDFAQAGQTVTGGPSRSAIKGITSFLHELASEDVMSSMKDMRKLMDQAGQMGMLGGVGDLQAFKQRFRQLIDQTKSIAQVLGTSVEEAMPMMGQMRQMGLWSAQDVMGTAISMKAAGPQGAQQMMGAMQTGAMMSRQAGGRMQAGARLGREMFENVQASTRMGMLSEQQIMEYTGGTGGAEGQRQVAQGLQQAMVNMSQHPMGQLLLAGLGETQGNKFTGRMDQGKMNQFLRGELGVEDLTAMGKKQVSNKARAASFMNRKQEMGQEMIAQGGLEAGNMMMQAVIEKALGTGALGQEPEVISQFIQKLSGADQRTADMAQQMFQDIGRTRLERRRQLEATLESSMRNLEYRKNRSWAGLKDALGHKWEEEIEKPLMKIGENLSTQIGEDVESFSDKLFGRVRPVAPTSSQALFKMMGKGGIFDTKTAGEGGFGMTTGQGLQDWVTPGAGGAVTGWAMGGSRGNALVQSGLEHKKGREGPGADEVELTGLRGSDFSAGAIQKANAQEVRYTSQRIAARAMTPSSLLELESPKRQQALETVKTQLQKLFTDPVSYSKLSKLKETNPEGYSRELSKRLRESAPGAYQTLTEGMKGTQGVNDMDVLAQAQNAAGWDGDKLAVDFKHLSNMAGVPADADSRSKLMAQIVEGMQDQTGPSLGATIGLGIAGTILTGGMGLVAALTNVGTKAAVGMGINMPKEDLERITTEYGADIAGVLRGGEGAEGAKNRLLAARKKDPALGKFYDYYVEGQRGGTVASKELATKISQWGESERKMAEAKAGETLKDIATRQGAYKNISGAQAGTTAGMERLRQTYMRGDLQGGTAQEAALAKGLTGDTEAEALFKHGGALGQQVGREYEIQRIGGMTETQYHEAMKKGGTDLFKLQSAEAQEEINAMWKKSGGKSLAGGDLAKVQDLMEKSAGIVKMFGGGGKSATAAGMDKFFSDYSSNKPIRVTQVDQSDQKPSDTLHEDVAKGKDVNSPEAE